MGNHDSLKQPQTAAQTANARAPETEASPSSLLSGGPTLMRAALQRKIIQRKASRAGADASGGVSIPEGGGAPLPGPTQQRMEQRIGARFDDVRVHTGSASAASADALGAHAFTVGSDVHFSAGAYAPGTREGDRLLAHELTHVSEGPRPEIQRDEKNGAQAPAGAHVSRPADPAEKRADKKADEVANALHDKKRDGPQTTNDLDALYVAAKAVHGQLVSIAQSVAAKCDGEAKVPDLKERGTAETKVKAEYGGDASRLTDIARGSVVCKTMKDVRKASEEIPKAAKVHRKKDRFAEPASGYRDMLFNLDIQGHICELQVQLKAIQEVKSGAGHKLYEQIRKIEQKAKLEGRAKLDDKEAAEVARLRAEMEGKYDEAFAPHDDKETH
jgi:hypothetical protein